MEELIEPLVNFLKVLGDSTRIKIIELLRNEEKTANEIQQAINKSQSTISQQLKILTNVDLLIVRRDGVKKYYKIKNPNIFDLISSLNAFVADLKKDKIDTLTSMDILDTLY